MSISDKKVQLHGASVVHDRGKCKICDQIRVKWYDSANRTAHMMAEEIKYCREQRKIELKNTKIAVDLAGELHERIDELETLREETIELLGKAWLTMDDSLDPDLRKFTHMLGVWLDEYEAEEEDKL